MTYDSESNPDESANAPDDRVPIGIERPRGGRHLFVVLIFNLILFPLLPSHTHSHLPRTITNPTSSVPLLVLPQEIDPREQTPERDSGDAPAEGMRPIERVEPHDLDRSQFLLVVQVRDDDAVRDAEQEQQRCSDTQGYERLAEFGVGVVVCVGVVVGWRALNPRTLGRAYRRGRVQSPVLLARPARRVRYRGRRTERSVALMLFSLFR